MHDNMNRYFMEFVVEYFGDLAVDEWNDVNRNFMEFEGEICGEFGVVGRLL